jgi:hypothetical protein
LTIGFAGAADTFLAMRILSKLTVGLTATVLGIGALFVGSAGAATTLGSTCVGSVTTDNIQLNPANSTATSAGVITSWGASFSTDHSGDALVLTVVAPTGSPNVWQIVQGSGFREILPGANGATFETRTPIAAGQTFAVEGTVPSCVTPGITTLKASSSGPPVTGVTFTTTNADDSTPATWAKVEPDVDGDGYGDETQDKCPQSKETAAACPIVKPSVTQVTAKNAFKLLLTANLASTATVTGTVKLPKPKKGKAKTLTITGKPKAITPGQLSAITLSYPSKLKTAVALLPRKKSLKLAVTLSVDGPITGPIDVAVLTYTQKIKGAAK